MFRLQSRCDFYKQTHATVVGTRGVKNRDFHLLPKLIKNDK